mmetsp:Transcript_7543/g.8632  ORF Transcript_7543/g.8632 Transcript_7543/m.8632 type:complete len:239 (+) Transcript_7543:526-1242(+)
MVDSFVIKVFSRYNRFDYVFHKIGRDLLVGYIFTVLSGDNDGVYTLWYWYSVNEFVFTSNLCLSIGAYPVAYTILTNLGKLGSDLGGKHVGEWHQLISLISGITKHDTLITGTNVFNLDGIYRLGDIGGLLLNGNNYITGLVIESLGWIVVSNVLDGITDDGFIVNLSGGGDFSKDHNHASFATGLACYTRHFISSNACIKNSVRYLIAEFIGVTLVYRFRSEKKGRHFDEFIGDKKI